MSVAKIMIVEDEWLVAQGIKESLEDLGYEVVGLAATGEEALQAAALHRPDLVLMDILLKGGMDGGDPFAAVILDLTIPGGMGGMEAIQHLRAQDPQARALVSSGYSDHPIMASYQDHGFQGVIAKPYKISGLSEVLQKVIVASEEEPAED